jgi:hypothetical protein
MAGADTLVQFQAIKFQFMAQSSHNWRRATMPFHCAE